MEELNKNLDLSQKEAGVWSQRFYKSLVAVAGLVYLLWWEVVEITLPDSFNPIGSRLAVVLFCWATVLASYFLPSINRNFEKWFLACLWVITLHYFYLFHRNEADINWVGGTYITVIAICACLQTEFELLSYAIWVLFLSIILTLHDHILQQTVFLPGIVTILALAYIGLRSRLKLLEFSKETSQRFQNLFHAVFEGIVVHDEGLILAANEAFAHIFGYQVHEVIGMQVKNFVISDAREMVIEKIAAMSEEPYEITGQKKDGSAVPIEIRGKKHTVQGKVLRLAAVSDLTARKKNEQDRILYEASQTAVQMRDEFLSIASHELKTPLTNIKLQTQLAMRSNQAEHSLRFAQQTDKQADRLIRLVEEMLDVSKISAGKLKINCEEFNLSELVKEVVDAFEASMKQSGISLQIELPDKAMVFADRFRIEQVISNLISNAIKYGNKKPIKISIEQNQNQVSLLIEDKGIGISFENQKRIFERFERAISSRNISGLGLGLYISKHIIDAHNGQIDLKSELDKGSRFAIRLNR